MEQIRFAPIIRVSTEKQEKQGSSLESQKQSIIDYVKSLKGIIPDSCWEYSGQEHATPGQERKKLEKLLNDASKNIYDAVMVVDPSRWSRDNLKSKEGINILRNNGIRFFIGTMEYDLHDPTASFYLGISAEINEMQARVQTLKSTKSRKVNANANQPSAGKLPYGRNYDKIKKVWSVDKEKKKIMEQVAKRYLAGEGILQIAKTFGMNAASLHKTLTQRCGTDWSIRFYKKKQNLDKTYERILDETISIKIPPLLDDATIKKIHEKIQINKTYTRGHHKYVYLLGGKVYCQRCGYSMASYRNHVHKTYYRHSRNTDHTKCDFKRIVPAVELENSVLLLLVQTFGDKEKIERAIQRATPDLEKVQSLIDEKATLLGELDKIATQKKNIIKSTSLGTYTDEDAKPIIDEIKDRAEKIEYRLRIVNDELESIPNPEIVKRSSKMASSVIANATMQNPELIFKRSYAWKRKLIEQAFSGVNPAGEPLGVYVNYHGKDKRFIFEIRGMFDNTIKSLPLSDEDLMDAFNLDSQYQDVDMKLNKIRSNLISQCHAYNGKCIY